MNFLKQSTAATVKMGPFLDEDDGKTAETGLTIIRSDIRITKNGGDYAQSNNTAGATHDEFGEYDIPLDATDTNTLGRLKVKIHVAGALPVWNEYMVIPSNVYDSIISGTDYLDVNSAQIEGADATDTIRDAVVDDATRIDASALNTLSSHDPGATITKVGDAMTLASGAITAAVIATDAIDADSIKADAVTEIQSGLATSSSLSSVASAITTIDGIVDSILEDTGTTIPDLISALNDISASDIRTIIGVNSSNQIAELSQGVPSATPSIAAGIMLLYMALRNKVTQTDSLVTIYNDSGTSICKGTVSDDDTTFTKQELVSGA